MKLENIIFPLLVFIGGCCYGPTPPVVKLAYADGYSFSEVTMSQYFFGWVMLLIIAAVFFIFNLLRKYNKNKSGIKKTSEKFELKNALCLLAAGVCIALVSTSYCISLQNVPAYIAVILLFQFTWIGALIESIAERKLPNRHTVAAIIILLTGTVLSAGVIGNEVELNAAGVFFGFLSAFFYALYIFLIGKSDENINPLNRSFIIISCALLVLIIIFSPSYFTSGVIFEGLWVYGLLLGSIGCALPIFLFSIGTVRISATAGTILSSSELPASIICAVIILSEPISALQWIGIVMILYGILHPYIAKGIKSKKPILHNSD